jgi:Asp/Glu/hydantoin racemase
MKHIILINPNTSDATTAMMIRIARDNLAADVMIEGMTARRGVPMILDSDELAAAAAGVVEMGESVRHSADGIIICAFGDPGIDELRSTLDIPVVGICQASILEASANGRRFGIATVTPKLVDSFLAKVRELGVEHLYTGTRLTAGDPLALASDAAALEDALAVAVQQSLQDDGAEAVIIGGGPLGQAAEGLSRRLDAPVVAPIASAVDLLMRQLGERSPEASDERR